MRDSPTGWKYTAQVPEERRQKLAAAGSFGELVLRVVNDVHVVRAYACPGSYPGLTDCLQPIFVIDLPETGDALFNGPYGYRAQYWLHPFKGLAANRELLDALAPKLMAAINLGDSPNLSKLTICTSLSAVSAKIWIHENSSLFGVAPDLAVEPWVAEADRAVELAHLGLFAPSIFRFEVKGALLDPYGNEVVPARKIRRHFEIHDYGFS